MAKMTDAPKVSVSAHARAMPFKSAAPATGAKVMVGAKKDEAESKDVKPKGLGTWSSFEVRASDNGGFTVRVSPQSSKSGMLGSEYQPPREHSYSSVEELDEYLDGLLGHKD